MESAKELKTRARAENNEIIPENLNEVSDNIKNVYFMLSDKTKNVSKAFHPTKLSTRYCFTALLKVSWQN